VPPQRNPIAVLENTTAGLSIRRGRDRKHTASLSTWTRCPRSQACRVMEDDWTVLFDVLVKPQAWSRSLASIVCAPSAARCANRRRRARSRRMHRGKHDHRVPPTPSPSNARAQARPGERLPNVPTSKQAGWPPASVSRMSQHRSKPAGPNSMHRLGTPCLRVIAREWHGQPLTLAAPRA
jgi:hypothetical protein